MLAVSFISWWYGSGYADLAHRVKSSLAKLVDQFSVVELFLTLFAPFKQIDAGRANASVPANLKLRIWSDRMFSRIFGAFVRFFTIIAGIIVLAAALLVGLVRLILWPLLPVMPVVGLILSIIGWIPWA